MQVVGIAVRVETEGRPTARGVMLDDSSGTPQIVNEFEFTGDDVDIATQLLDLAEATRSRLAALQPERVVVRRADFPPRASRQPGPKLRLLAEGAIVSVARSKVVSTHLGTGKEIGEWRGNGKNAVDQEARAMIKGSGRTLKWCDAAAAALGALAHP